MCKISNRDERRTVQSLQKSVGLAPTLAIQGEQGSLERVGSKNWPCSRTHLNQNNEEPVLVIASLMAEAFTFLPQDPGVLIDVFRNVDWSTFSSFPASPLNFWIQKFCSFILLVCFWCLI